MPTLTEITLRNLKPPARGQKTYVCDSIPGFGVRVSQGGTKTFVLVHGQNRERITLGRYPIIALADARTDAKRILAEKTLGKHRPQSIAWDEARDLFLAQCEQENKPRTLADYRRLLNRHFGFGRTKLSVIAPGDINRRLDKLTSVPSERSHALRVLKIFFNWAASQHYVDISPCGRMQVAKVKSKSRVLTDAELALVWRAADEDVPFHKIVRLCILLGQRRSEIGLLRGEYIDRAEHTITLPVEIVKNNRSHTFPFGDMADEILSTLPSTGYLFGGRWTDEKPFNGWAKCKRELDAKIRGEAEQSSVAPWTLHDLRRTCSTNWARLRIPPHIIDRLLNHVTGSVRGSAISEVAAIYNRHEYLPEMCEALTAWEVRLKAVIS